MDIQLEREGYKLEIKLKVLTKVGIDVTEISEEIEAAKNAIQAGDYESARELIEQAKNMLRDAFMQGRGKMKEINLPVERGRGRP